MIPLYKSDDKWEDLVQCCTANPGLIFDRYPGGWVLEGQKCSLQDGAKKDFYNSIIDRYKSSDLQYNLKANLAQALARQKSLVESVLGGETIQMKTDWRFVSGMGAAHPYETGFIWHRTLAVPYLPGSSVKGMMRAWAEQWQNDESIREQAVVLFGSTADSDTKDSGSLIIFDALPVSVPVLELDILNPHYQDYYSDPSTPPADYLNPVPVFFLTVAANQDFIFSLAPRPGAHESVERARADLKTGMQLLKDALANIGAGGKTAVGYGLMQESSVSIQNRLEREKRLQQEQTATVAKEEIKKAAEAKGYIGIAAKMYQESREAQWEKHHDNFYDAAQAWMKLLEVENNQKIIVHCVEIISNILAGHYPGILENPDKKKGKKAEKFFYQKPRARELAKQLIALQVHSQPYAS